MNEQSTKELWDSEYALCIHGGCMSLHTSPRPIECTTPSVDPSVSHGFGRQAWVNGASSTVTRVPSGGGEGRLTVGQAVGLWRRGRREFSALCASFCCDPVLRSLSRVQLCDPTDYGPPGSSVYGMLQARYWSE